MSDITPILGLYLPGGGSEGIRGDDEAADVDRLNDDLLLLDAAVGIQRVTSSTYPSSPFVNQVVFVSDLDDLRRWNGSTWASVIPARLSSASLANTYYSKANFSSGVLDTRYYTQTQLLTGGVLDSLYTRKDRIASGTVNITPGGDHFGTATVHFAQMSDIPRVFATAHSSSDAASIQVTVTSITTTSAVIVLNRSSNVATNIDWMAVGPDFT